MKNLTSGRVRWIVLALVAGLVIGGVAMQPALGGGLFTKKKAKKLFYKKGQSDSRYLPKSGPVQIQVSPDNWVSDDLGSVNHFIGYSTLIGNGLFRTYHLALTVPDELQGAPLRIDSFEICYRIQPNAAIDQVDLTKTTPTSANVSPAPAVPINDLTTRPAGEATCRAYAAGSPIPTGAQDLLQINLVASFSSASFIQVTRTTVNMSD